MADSPDLKVLFDSRDNDGQLQHGEQISKSDIHVGQGSVIDEQEGEYVNGSFSHVNSRRPPFLKPEIHDGIDDSDDFKCYFQVCAKLGTSN